MPSALTLINRAEQKISSYKNKPVKDAGLVKHDKIKKICLEKPV